jgi:hypothetical protein
MCGASKQMEDGPLKHVRNVEACGGPTAKAYGERV